MKIVVLNGSPRQGNTKDLLDAFLKGVKDAEVTYYDAGKGKVLPCEGCDACFKLNKCKHNDDTNMIINKLIEADAIVFGTPVYFWGISAQLKAVIDKMYMFNTVDYKVPGKKIGLISVGGADLENMQYQLISDQMKCICDFLKWDLCFDDSFKAYQIGDIRKDSASLEKCEGLFDKLI